VWDSADAYERYVGRWSRLVALAFLDWLAISVGGKWLDVGCGTGELSRAILVRAQPESVLGVDPSEHYIAAARASAVRARPVHGR
jgi:ubiquinone/menaquinone biosynthesis C-methylase UbiE